MNLKMVESGQQDRSTKHCQPCLGKQPVSQAAILAPRHSKSMAWIAAWPGKGTLPKQATKQPLKIS
jgi:hypothetical protein